MKAALLDYIRAKAPAIYVQSPEAKRVCADICDELKRPAKIKPAVVHMSLAGTASYLYKPKNTPMTDPKTGQARKVKYIPDDDLQDLADPIELVEKLMEAENTVFVFEDFHMFFDDVMPPVIGLLKKMFTHFKNSSSMFIVVGCRSNIPPELEKEFIYIEYEFPDKERLAKMVELILAEAKIKMGRTKMLEVAGALSGLTMQEAENIMYLSMTKNKGEFPVKFIANEKAMILKKSGTLEIIEASNGIDDIGGLDVLKTWLCQRTHALGAEAKKFGLPAPKGILMLGLPGTGKSLTAKATANILKRPLLRLDAGSVFGSLVGQSEQNLRNALQIAESISPCVLWIDEIEKAFSGTKSSGTSDGGTTSRVFGTMLTWMQDKKSPVFVIGTANDVTALPEEFLRKGRFDEIWFCDLPNDEEREVIWNIQIKKHGRDAATFDSETLASLSEGFTGAEIEQCFIESMYDAFHEKKEVGIGHLLKAVNACVPLSKMMRENISETRNWAKNRCRMASVA